jgi:hypothetical protein
MPKATRDDLIREALTEGVVDYDPETGYVAVNGSFSVHPDGYLVTSWRGQALVCHRIMWIAHHWATLACHAGQPRQQAQMGQPAGEP